MKFVLTTRNSQGVRGLSGGFGVHQNWKKPFNKWLINMLTAANKCRFIYIHITCIQQPFYLQKLSSTSVLQHLHTSVSTLSAGCITRIPGFNFCVPQTAMQSKNWRTSWDNPNLRGSEECRSAASVAAGSGWCFITQVKISGHVRPQTG